MVREGTLAFVDDATPDGLTEVGLWEFVRIGPLHGDELWTPADGPLAGVLVPASAVNFAPVVEEYDPNE